MNNKIYFKEKISIIIFLSILFFSIFYIKNGNACSTAFLNEGCGGTTSCGPVFGSGIWIDWVCAGGDGSWVCDSVSGSNRCTWSLCGVIPTCTPCSGSQWVYDWAGTNACPTGVGTNGQICEVRGGNCCDQTNSGGSTWDKSESKCVGCGAGKTENVIYGSPSGIWGSGTGGDGECESACGASADCDEVGFAAVNNHCHGTSVWYCNYCVDTFSQDCASSNGWYDTSPVNYQWVSTGDCTEKQQKQQEYRSYTCSGGGCTYSGPSTQWVDTGSTRNKGDGTACTPDSLSCTSDACSSGSCIHTLQSGWCFLAGACVASGTLNPNNECQACDSTKSVFTWSSRSNGVACGSQHCSDSAAHSNGDDTTNVWAKYQHNGACSSGSCAYSSINCDIHDSDSCSCTISNPSLIDECHDYECVPMFGNLCAWTGDWITANTWTCGSSNVGSTQSCRGTTYYCCGGGSTALYCNKGGQTYFQDKISLASYQWQNSACSYSYVDADSICRSSGSLQAGDGCTADSQCNGVAAGTGNCDSSCKYVPPACTCTGWTNDVCGGNACSGSQMHQTRSCSPAASCVGVATSQCVGPTYGGWTNQGCGISCGSAGVCPSTQWCQKRTDGYGCAVDQYQCTGSCGASCSDSDSGNVPLTAGTCTDTSSHPDSCSGTTLTEYYCSGTSCISTAIDCQSYETLYCSAGNIYRNEWQCSGSPGYCNNGAADTLVQTCSDACSDTDGGQTYTTQGTVTDNNLCSAGQTSCPSTSNTDYCVSAATLREYYCSGSSSTYTDYSCANLGAGYTCSGGRCVSGAGCTCGNSIIECTEQCDPQATNSNQCGQSTSNCDYATRRYCTRDSFGNCNSACACVLDSWSCGTADDSNYCNNCASHCGDSTCNCGETSLSCPGDCPVVCTPNGCNGNCPVGCTVAQDPDCGCSNSNGCCGIGCNSGNDNDCAAATYSATFSQTGIPAGTTWGVTVGGTRYTSTSSSVTVSGLSGSVAYSYDDPVSGGSGIRYDCTSSCSGSVSSSTTITASYGTQYYLTMQVNPAGSGTVSPSSGWYNSGSSVSISATASGSYTFSSWSDGGAQTHSITVSSAMTRTANFNSITGITVTSLPTGGGYVTVDGSAITTPQSYSWTQGSTHTLAAISPVSCGSDCRYVFTSWSDGGAQSHTITTPAAATTYTANYQLQYYLTMQVNPAGSGTVSPSSGWYNSGSSVSISATANAGYTFSSWSDGGAQTHSITVSSAMTRTANFLNLITVTSSPSIGPGFVRVDGAAITTPQTFSWAQGSSHTISANSPVSCGVGCQFYYTSWSDGGLQSHGITISGSGTYTANFQRQYYLTMLADPATGGTLTPSSGWRNTGTSVGILATSTGSCMFSSWTGIGTGSYSGTNNPSIVTMSAAITETANFDCGTANSMNFTGYLNYSNGQPVKNSLIKMTIKNNTLGYEKAGIDETDQYGFFFVKIQNIPDNIMSTNLDISIYVLGDIEALYDCWYNHTSGNCCSVPLSGPC